ncbi:hypothetical protein [Pandoraea sp. NPDC087047]|uniref:hypothetical protein n=1 Tax=Pandoraea sp. NPDC087047 TaxID=3364390 RepID=UPI003817D23E
MYSLDTNVISESRKGGGGDEGVQRFMRMTDRLKAQRLFICDYDGRAAAWSESAPVQK